MPTKTRSNPGATVEAATEIIPSPAAAAAPVAADVVGFGTFSTYQCSSTVATTVDDQVFLLTKILGA